MRVTLLNQADNEQKNNNNKKKRYEAVCLCCETGLRVRECACACKFGRERERENFSINIYARQTDQWLLKRSRADDDGYRLYVLTAIMITNAYVRALAQTRTHACTHARWGQMIGINSLIMLNLSKLIP